MKTLVPVVAIVGLLATAGGVHAEIDITPAGGFETVFDWAHDRCKHQHFPDSPARVLRRRDGSLVMMAAHLTNIPMVGASFERLASTCGVEARAHRNPDPAAFDDEYWIQAIGPTASDGAVRVLLSHDYNGIRHEVGCASQQSANDRSACWRAGILLGTTTDTLSPVAVPSDGRRVVATTREYRNVAPIGRQGFFTTSNIATRDGHSYFVGFAIDGRTHRNCLFRADDGRTEIWRARSVTGFDLIFSPRDGEVPARIDACDALPTWLTEPIRSLVWLDKASRWMAVFKWRSAPDPSAVRGVYYITSADLTTWSPPRPLLELGRGPADRCDVSFEYPSVVDHASPSRFFDTVGDSFHLYLTRFNAFCRVPDNRDLVRMRFEVRTAD